VRRAAATFVHLLLGAVLLYAAVRFSFKIFYFLRSPWSRDYGEGAVLAMVQVLRTQGTYFTSLRDYPLVTGNYPPVFVGLVALGDLLFGPSIFFPRLLSILATLGLVAVLVVLLRRLTGDGVLALAFGFLFLAPWFVQTWGALGRIDMPALLFSVAGLLVFARTGEEAGTRRYLAFPLFWLAFFTRQNALIAPAAVVLHLLLGRDRRAALRAIAAFAVPLLVLFGLLVLATSGEAWRHLIVYTGGVEYEWPRMFESYGEFFLIASPLLGLVVAGVFLLKGELLRGPYRLFILYWALSLLSLVTIAKVGAGQNYFIEPWLATVVLGGLVLAALGARWPEMKAGRWPGVLVAALVASFASPGADRIPQAIRNPRGAADMIELDKTVRETAGPIVSENLVVLAENRKPIVVEPFGYMVITRSGRVRPDRLLFDCEHGRFALVVTEYRLRDIPGFSDCLDRRYYAWKDLGPYQVFRPLGRTESSSGGISFR
jgi:4-amino-4-deoxy-L-arabinose transferase-like glycosyltransferase